MHIHTKKKLKGRRTGKLLKHTCRRKTWRAGVSRRRRKMQHAAYTRALFPTASIAFERSTPRTWLQSLHCSPFTPLLLSPPPPPASLSTQELRKLASRIRGKKTHREERRRSSVSLDPPRNSLTAAKSMASVCVMQ